MRSLYGRLHDRISPEGSPEAVLRVAAAIGVDWPSPPGDRPLILMIHPRRLPGSRRDVRQVTSCARRENGAPHLWELKAIHAVT